LLTLLLDRGAAWPWPFLLALSLKSSLVSVARTASLIARRDRTRGDRPSARPETTIGFASNPATSARGSDL